MYLKKLSDSDIKKMIRLRQEVLHPAGPVDRVKYKKDKHEEAFHVAFVKKAEDEKTEVLVAVGSLLPESELEEYSPSVYRIRGMAVLESQRGKGLGQKILEALLEHAEQEKATKVWCNARVSVLDFYLKNGFAAQGEPFELPGGIPHFRMVKVF